MEISISPELKIGGTFFVSCRLLTDRSAMLLLERAVKNSPFELEIWELPERRGYEIKRVS